MLLDEEYCLIQGEMQSSVCANNERHDAVIKVDSWCSQFRNASNPWMARYVYALMFLLAYLLAWAVRDYSYKYPFKKMERLTCEDETDCSGPEGVMRVSLGCFTFYFTMYISTVGTSKLNSPIDKWHSGWWSAKIVLWIVVLLLSFLVPSGFINIYGQIAHFGAGVFLLIQLISIISFITWFNNYCQFGKYAERCHIHVMVVATTAYVICTAAIISMYIWYVPKSSCYLNIFFITLTLVLLQVMTSASLHPRVNAGFLAPGLMGLYVVFLCWCAIRSEPSGTNCAAAGATAKTDWLTIISFIVALVAMIFAAFSTGIDSQCFQFRKKETRMEDDVPYGFGFFHFVFATGAMYFSMLLVSWNTNNAMRKWTVDVGWTSTWVRIVNEWLAVCIYLWMLVAPIIWKNRQAADNAI